MRLNGWKRIGIVASVVWVLGGFIFTYHYETKSDVDLAIMAYSNCRSVLTQDEPRIEECNRRESDVLNDLLPYVKLGAAVVALVPIPFGWGLVYLIIFVVRWVRRGFSSVSHASESHLS